MHWVRVPLVGVQALSFADDLHKRSWEGVTGLSLSLLGVLEVDASGVVALIRLYSQLRVRGVEMELVDVRPNLIAEFDRLGLTELIPIRRAIMESRRPQVSFSTLPGPADSVEFG